MDELGKLCPNLSFTVENKMGNLHKKEDGHILNLHKWFEMFHFLKVKSLRIYQWIKKKNFHWGKWNEPIENYAYATECLVKRPWRYIFPAYVYKSIALVNEHKRLKY